MPSFTIELEVLEDSYELEVSEDSYELDVLGNSSVDFEQGEYVSIKTSAFPDYAGTYEISPSSSDQTLDTKDRHMTSNVTVLKVPYQETSNESGGVTVSIMS